MTDQHPFIDHARHRQAIEARRREIAQNPEMGRSVIRARVTLLHDVLKEAQAGPFRFKSDEPERMGGGGEAPQPLQYFVAAVGFWLLTQVARFASEMDIDLEAADMELRGTFPMAEKYGVGGGGAAMEDLVYELNIKSSAPPEQIKALVTRSERYCHASQSLQKPVPVIPLLRLNGEEVPLD